MKLTFKYQASVDGARRLAMLSALMLLLIAVTGIAHAAPNITMPLVTGYFDDMNIYYVNTETSDQGVAAADGTNYVPKLAATHASGAEADIFPFFGNANPAQRNVVDSAPMPIGPGNMDPQYSPLWDVVPVQFVDQERHNYPLVRSTTAIDKLEQRGLVTVGTEPGVIVNCPVVRVARHYTWDY